MKILVTGGLGFIGSNLLKYWEDKYSDDEILNIDNKTYAANDLDIKYDTEEIDIRDKEAVKSIITDYKPDCIIHLAACSHVDNSILSPREFVETNVVGTFNLLEASKSVGVDRFHHVSTDEVFGSLEADQPAFTELHPYDPSSAYSATKAGSDHLVRAWSKTYGLPITISNSSNNYGPYQHEEKFIPKMIWHFANDKVLPIYGDGSNIRDWVFVRDHVEALDMIIRKGTIGNTYNVGGNLELTNLELVNQIKYLMEKRNGYEDLDRYIGFTQDRLGHDFRYAIDTSKIENEIGWKPSKNFKEHLAQTIDWYLTKWEV